MNPSHVITEIHAPQRGVFPLTDPRRIPPDGAATLRNLRFDNGYLRTRDGFTITHPAVNSFPVLDLINLQFFDGSVETIGGSAATGTTGATSAIQRDLNSVQTGVDLDNTFGTLDDDRYVAVIAPWAAETKGRMIVSNGRKIKSWQGAATAMADVVGGFPARHLLIGPDARLFMGWTQEGGIDFPMRLRWSVVGLVNGNGTDFSGTGSGVLDLNYDSWQITGIWNQGGRIFVGKERSLATLVPTGIATDAYSREIIHRGEGVFAPGSLVQHGDLTAFLSHRNFVLFDGMNFKDVGGPVWQAFKRRFNYGATRQVTSLFDGPNQRVGWGLPLDGSQRPTEMWWLNIATGAWEFDVPFNHRSVAIYTNVDFTTVDELIGTVDGLAGTIDALSSTRSAKERIILGSSGGSWSLSNDTAGAPWEYMSPAIRPVGNRYINAAGKEDVVTDRDFLMLDEITVPLVDYGASYTVNVYATETGGNSYTPIGGLTLTTAAPASPTSPRIVDKVLNCRFPFGKQVQIKLECASSVYAGWAETMRTKVLVMGETRP